MIDLNKGIKTNEAVCERHVAIWRNPYRVSAEKIYTPLSGV